ncbi:MAG: hypothetical protein M3O91_10835 [Chloroflexota bacterium]|nr:hypothetical protein [Chloroflexota bacterium]
MPRSLDVALLANYGLLPGLSVTALLGLWPVLVILLGIDIAFGRRWPLWGARPRVAARRSGCASRTTFPRR